MSNIDVILFLYIVTVCYPRNSATDFQLRILRQKCGIEVKKLEEDTRLYTRLYTYMNVFIY
jgi:hypothetical protein